MEKGGSFGRTHRPGTRVRQVPKQGEQMILSVVVVLKEICEKGRDYLWPRPQACPCCKAGRPWGHGFVLAYFDGLKTGIFLRRYRCNQCGCVIRLKPEGYFKKFQSPIQTIRTAIRNRLERRSSDAVQRTLQDHWLKALKRKTRAYLGDRFEHHLLEAFDRLCEMGKVPVSRSI